MFQRVIVMPVLATMLATAAAIPASAVELVGNGGFETGDFTGWTRFGALGQTNVSTDDAITGSYGGRFSPNTPGGGISQDLATAADTSYRIRFDLAHAANQSQPNNDFSVSFDGVVLVSLIDVATMPVTSYSFTALAGSDLTELKFIFRDNRDSPANRWSIDNISVAALGGVPEPAGWAMLLVGFSLVGYAARRGRNALPAVTA